MLPRARSYAPAAHLFGVLATFSGCLTYSDVLRDAHSAALGGDWEAAEGRLNSLLGVESREEVPEALTSDKTVAILERGIVLQAQGAFQESRRDLSAAEEGLEKIDFEHDAAGKLSTYLYSASEANYAAPPVERMAINSFNMLNYLALGELQGASVEARRYQVMRDFLENTDQDPPRGRLGAYLAGFTFEHLGEPERALRYYDEVLAKGDMASLDDALLRLAKRGRYRGEHIGKTLLRLQAGERTVPAAPAPDGGPPPAPRPPQRNATSEILVVASLGRSPQKVAQRMPIGAAIGLAGAHFTGDLAILERSIFKVLVFPELEAVPSVVTGVRIHVDGDAIPSDVVERLGNEVSNAYERVKPALIGQALTRLATRAAISEGTRIATKEGTSGSGGNALATILALGAEALLTGLDKPDTRSWTFLPNRVYAARIPVPPGEHEVRVELAGGGGSVTREVEVKENSFAVVVVTEPR